MRGMARADFVTSLFLMVLGIGVVAESWRMPRYTEFASSVWSAPGVTPGLIGVVLAILGAVLFFRSRRTHPAEAPGEAASGGASWPQAAVAFALCFGFAAILVGRIPFMVASFLFVVAFILLFDFLDNRDAYRDRLQLIRRVVTAAGVSGAAAWAISTIFQDVFFVRLP
jgi:hypothetical protein